MIWYDLIFFTITVERYLLLIRRIWVKLSSMFILLLARSEDIDVQTTFAVSQLALKHRENKNLRHRIIVFVGSPLDVPGTDEQSMVKGSKEPKENNVEMG